MKFTGLFLSALAAIGPVAARRSPQHVGKRLPRIAEEPVVWSPPSLPTTAHAKRDSVYLNHKSASKEHFAVNGLNLVSDLG